MNTFARRILADVQTAANRKQLDKVANVMTKVLGPWTDINEEDSSEGTQSIFWRKASGAKKVGAREVTINYFPRKHEFALEIKPSHGKAVSVSGKNWKDIVQSLKKARKGAAADERQAVDALIAA